MAKLDKLNDQELSNIAVMLKALSDPTRLKIMQFLHDGEKSVGDIVAEVGTAQANISRHLSILSRAHLLISRRDKTTVYYKMIGPFVLQLCSHICEGYKNSIAKKFGA